MQPKRWAQITAAFPAFPELEPCSHSTTDEEEIINNAFTANDKPRANPNENKLQAPAAAGANKRLPLKKTGHPSSTLRNVTASQEENEVNNERQPKKSSKDTSTQTGPVAKPLDQETEEKAGSRPPSRMQEGACDMRMITSKMENMERRLDALIDCVQAHLPNKNLLATMNPKKEAGAKPWNKPPTHEPRSTFGSKLRQLSSRDRCTVKMSPSEVDLDNPECPTKHVNYAELENRVRVLETLVLQLKRNFVKSMILMKVATSGSKKVTRC